MEVSDESLPLHFPTETLTVASKDQSIYNLSKKNILLSPISPPYGLFVPSGQSLSLGESSSSGLSTMSSVTGNDSPNTAPMIPPNMNFSDTLDYTGHQSWFYTQAPSAGQFTMHLRVPQINVDYDLYVYKLYAGNVLSFKASQRVGGSDEHISFLAETGEIYFIVVYSYSGSSTELYTLYNSFDPNPEISEVNDFPENARIVVPNTVGISGEIATLRDEDFIKFTVPTSANRAVLTMIMQDVYGVIPLVYGYVYNENLVYQGAIEPNANVPIMVSPGTYYIRVLSEGNLYYSNLNYNYSILVNTFNSSGTIGQVLGRNSSNNRIAYMTTANTLWVNSDLKISSISLSFSRQVTIPQPQKSTRFNVTSGAIHRALFISYSSSMENELHESSSASNAIWLLPVHFSFSNMLSMGGQSDLFADTFYNEDLFWKSGFVYDLDTGKLKDFLSPVNGYYNSDIFDGYMGHYINSYTVQ
jgi:hypothetical protein